jgi:glycosyltransferase involved in cell wall biosynthesis
MKQRLIFLMPQIERNVFSAQELLDRQNLYASYFAKEMGEDFEKALVLYSGTDSPLSVREYEFINSAWIGPASTGLLTFLKKSIFHIKRFKQNRFVLIAGTPFQPLFLARAISLLVKHTSIQVSIHGEIKGIKLSPLKYHFLKSQIGKVSGIRFVSTVQREEFIKEIRIGNTPSVVTPVPIEVKQQKKASVKRSQVLGFVGRIHKERDPLLWVEIANELPEMKHVIIGAGPLELEMKSSLRDGDFYGHLERNELMDSWSGISVLLSTAPHESYGLSTREALLNGIPVVARNSAGSRELAEKFPELIKLFEEKNEAVLSIRYFNENPPDIEDFTKFRTWFIQEQENSLQNLAKLWHSI